MHHKYKAGAGVYLICNNGNEYIVYPDLLEVARLSVDENGNHYSLATSDGDRVDWCREHNIFYTYAEAEQACKELNILDCTI